jgi:DNA-binding transcriptional regulator PaaX
MNEEIQKKKERSRKIGPVAGAILVSIAVVGTVTVAALFPGVALIAAPFLKKKKYSHKQAVQKNLKSLIHAGLIKESINAQGEVHLELTKKGKWETFLWHSSHDEQKTEWDKVWRIVVFDVPQSKNKLRAELRRAMRLFGFKMIQQSVWVYPYACDDFISLLKSHLGVSNDVLYMKVSYIENDAHLRKEFNIGT